MNTIKMHNTLQQTQIEDDIRFSEKPFALSVYNNIDMDPYLLPDNISRAEGI